MQGTGLIQLAIGRVGRGSSNSSNGELDKVRPTRPMSSWIGRSNSPLGELDVACPSRPMAGQMIPDLVVSKLGSFRLRAFPEVISRKFL